LNRTVKSRCYILQAVLSSIKLSPRNAFNLYFYKMAYLEKQLIIKRSQIPGAGKGLYTKKEIAKGERIVEYKGKIITWPEAKQQKYINGYIFYITRNHVIDAYTYIKALARYANDARGFAKIKGLTNNAEYVVDGGKAYIDAKRKIEKGEEILVGYGKEYWDNLKHDLKANEASK